MNDKLSKIMPTLVKRSKTQEPCGVCRSRFCILIAMLVFGIPSSSLFSQNIASDSRIQKTSNQDSDSQVVISGKQNFGFRLLERQIELLKNYPPLISELNLSDSQTVAVREFLREYQQSINQMARDNQQLRNVDRATKLLEFHQQLDDKLTQILIPPQKERLQQLGLQSFGAAQGQEVMPFINLLGNPGFREHVGISSGTAQKLRLKMQEENRKLLQETAKLRKLAEEAVLAEMSEDDRNRFLQLFGDPYSFGKMEQSLGSRIQNSEDK